jgi:hypothetical protein
MTIALTPEELAILNQIATTTSDMNKNGVTYLGAPYFTDMPLPVKDYAQIFPPGSRMEKVLTDAVRVAALPTVRQFLSGSSFQASNTSPNFTGIAGTATTLLSTTVVLGTAKTMQITANFSAYALTSVSRVDYWIEVNGVPTDTFHTPLQLFHQCVSGSWIVSMPAGSCTVTLRAKRGTGIGTINLNSDDFIAISAVS